MPAIFEEDKEYIINAKKNGYFEDALTRCATAFEQYPEHIAELYFLRGEVYYARNTTEDGALALADFQQAFEHGESHAELYLKRASIYMRSGEYPKALNNFDQAIALTPSVFAYQQRAVLYRDAEQYTLAHQDLRQALQLESNNPFTWFDIATLHYIQSQFFQAQHLLNEKVLPLAEHHRKRAILSTKADNLHAAMTEKKQQWLEQFNEPGDSKNAEQQTVALFKAVAVNKSTQVRQLLQHVPITSKDVMDNSLLHICAQYGYSDLLFELAGKGLSFDECNRIGQTPLFVAITYEQLQTVTQLLHRGADKKQLWQQQTILQYAVMRGCRAIAAVLLKDETLVAESGGLPGVLAVAIQYHQQPLIEQLLDEQPVLSSASYGKEPLLSIAVKTGSLELVFVWLRYQILLPEQESALTAALAYAKKLNKDDIAGILTNQRGAHRNLIQRGQKQAASLLELLQQRLRAKADWPYDIQAVWEALITTIGRILPDMGMIELGGGKPQFIWSWLCQAQDEEALTSLGQCLADAVYQRRDAIIIYQKNIILKDTVTLEPSLLQHALAEGFAAYHQPKPPLLAADEEKSAEPPLPEMPVHIQLFCNHFETLFMQIYYTSWAFFKGELEYVSDKTDQAVGMMKQVSQQINSISVPGVPVNIPVATIGSAAAAIFHYVRNQMREERARLMVELFSQQTPLEQAIFIHQAAFAVAVKYSGQIEHLEASSKGVEQFAEMMVKRVVHYISSRESHRYEKDAQFLYRIKRELASWCGQYLPYQEKRAKALDALFFDAILQTTKINRELECTRLRTQTLAQDEWTARGIIDNTAIITSDGRRYVSNEAIASEHPAKYGYCLGTEQEARRRSLVLLSTSEDPRWQGRFMPLFAHAELSVSSAPKQLVRFSQPPQQEEWQQPMGRSPTVSATTFLPKLRKP